MAKPEKPNKNGKSEIDAALVKKLAGLLDETGLGEIEYATDEWRIRVARAPAASTTQAAVHMVAPATAVSAGESAAAATQAAQTADAAHPGAVTSPMVGTVYLSPAPDQPAFVKTGDAVKAGQTLLIIEAMKVMNPVAATRAGKVVKICVENGAPVEFGAALMIVE